MPRKDIAKDGERTRFSSENQPKNRGVKDGPNRASVLKKWLFAEMEITNPITNQKEKGNAYNEVILALISKARQGDIQAIKEIQDTLHGKLTDKVQIDVNQLDADIERELALFGTGSEGTASGETESETVN